MILNLITNNWINLIKSILFILRDKIKYIFQELFLLNQLQVFVFNNQFIGKEQKNLFQTFSKGFRLKNQQPF